MSMNPYISVICFLNCYFFGGIHKMKKFIFRKNVLKEASVLLITLVMILSSFIVIGNKVNTSEVGASILDNGMIIWYVSGSNQGDTFFSDSPLVEITNPEDGDDVSGLVVIEATASDPSGAGIQKVTFSIDGTEIGYDDTAPYTAIWDSTGYSDGWHTITATAITTDGYTDSDEITVCLGGNCDNNPPNTPYKPSGPTTGEPDVEYTYTTITTDPDGDKVRYGWEWNGDNTVDGWTGLYYSGVTCAVGLIFDEIGTYYIRVLSEDEYGARSNFSRILTIVISYGCINFKGFNCCPVGENTMLTVEGNNMSVTGMIDDDGFTTAIPSSNDVYQCNIEDALGSPSVSLSGKISGSFNNIPFWMQMTIGSNTSSGSSFGVYPVGYQGSSSGAPSIIAWVKSDDCQGDWEIVFRKKCEWTSSLDLGYIEFPVSSLGVYPVGYQGSSSGAPSIIMYPGDECGDVLWSWSSEGVDRLNINALMVTYVTICITCGEEHPLLCTCGPIDHAGYLYGFSLSASGVSNITVSDMWAKHNVIPSSGDIGGPDKGKKGETYTFSTTLTDSDDAYLVGMWNFGQGDDTLYDGVYPTGFSGTASGAPSMINWTYDKDGTYAVKVRVFDMNMGVSPWVTHEINIPKGKVKTIDAFFLRFLENYPIFYQLLQRLQSR